MKHAKEKVWLGIIDHLDMTSAVYRATNQTNKNIVVSSTCEPCREKTNILHMRKQRRRSASR